MSIDRRYDLKRKARKLTDVAEDARALAERLGLEPVPVNYWLVDYDEMNALIAYDGFQTRYPHWRWGMAYDRQRKTDRFGAARAFEIVVNDEPAHAFLQESNSSADQKAVITHVEAHADFFANNRWYGLFAERVDAAAMLETHARRIESYMADPEIGRETVERWIDSVLTLVDTIDQHRAFEEAMPVSGGDEAPDDTPPLSDLAVSDEVKAAVFDDEWVEAYGEEEPSEEPVRDVLAYLRTHGRQYDEETGKAVPMEPWRQDVIDVLRAESYYFAPQKMTKVMNEGWAAFWESIMMGEEAFAGDDEFLLYAEHMALVLGSPGLNPYKLGKELWEHVEAVACRREVAERLLGVEGISVRNFHDAVDFERVRELLLPEPPLDSITPETVSDLSAVDASKVDRAALDRALSGELDFEGQPWRLLTYAGLAERHFALNKREKRGFLEAVERDDLERYARYQFEADRYDSVEEALADVDYAAGWDRMYEVRESHNDVTFLSEFLTPAFVREGSYFAYEHSYAADGNVVSSTDAEDVKKKLLLLFTNFGKPRIEVEDGNYDNRNELLLVHRYNGIQLDVDQAADTLERVFDLWGRPVNLKTIVKSVDENTKQTARRRGREPEAVEQGKLLRYDGEEFTVEELDWSEVEDIAADDVDYATKPEDWLG